MFVRFKKTARSGGNSISAYLVESKRVGGKPRQRVVCYLATVRIEKGATVPRAWLRLGFWLDATRALDKLDVPQECRERLTAQMATRVPFLAPEDYPGALEAQQRAARYHGQPVPTYEEGLPFVRPVSKAA